MTNEILAHAIAHALTNLVFLPITVLLMMLLRFGGFFDYFKLPTPNAHQMFGIAILIMMAG